MLLPPNPIRLVQKEFAIAKRLFCILIDGDDDRLDMVIAIPFAGRAVADLSQCFDPRRIVGVSRGQDRAIRVKRITQNVCAQDNDNSDSVARAGISCG
jgi:hypothetical protein